jgi:hypothetical protein
MVSGLDNELSERVEQCFLLEKGRAEAEDASYAKKMFNQLMNLLNSEQHVSVLYYVMQLTGSNNYKNIIRAVWQYRINNLDKVDFSISLLYESLADKPFLNFCYLHLSRRGGHKEILDLSINNKVIYDFYRESGALFRSYIISRARIPQYVKYGDLSCWNKINIFPEKNKNLATTSKEIQFSFLNRKATSVNPFLSLVKEKLLHQIELGIGSKFIDSLKKIKDAGNIAVVLKGPSLKAKKLGFLIDSHDLVIGVNFSDQSDSNLYGREKDIHYYAPFLLNDLNVLNDNEGKCIMFCGNDGLDEYQNERHKEIRRILSDVSYNSATTGFSAILLILLISKGHVSVFGFDSYSTSFQAYINSSPKEKMIYEKGRNFAAPIHDIDYEYWFIHRLCQELLFKNSITVF